MTEPLAIKEAAPPAGFVEKVPLEQYVPPAKPSLVGLSREQLSDEFDRLKIAGGLSHFQTTREHLPDALRDRIYYRPTERGAEKELGERLSRWRKWREQRERA